MPDDTGTANRTIDMGKYRLRTLVDRLIELDEADVLDEFLGRMATPHPVVEVSPGEAPVREIVLTGDDADLTRLPFHPRREFDGGAYITLGIDFAIDPETGLANTGARLAEAAVASSISAIEENEFQKEGIK